MALSLIEAERLVLAELEHWNPGCGWEVASVTERSWGWVIACKTDPEHGLTGGGSTFLVDASDGVVLSVGRNVDESVARYEAGAWPWQDLGWAKVRAAQEFGRAEDACSQLLELFTQGADPIRLEKECLAILNGSDDRLIAVAAKCCGQLAREQKALRQPTEVTASLRSLVPDPQVGAACVDALDEISRYASPLPASEITWNAWIAEAEGHAG
jgi:hypothetical protein